jgi:pimeloyl-ACP methyl ester carboxylesterase
MPKRFRISIFTAAVILAAVLMLWLFQDHLIYHRKTYRPESLQYVDREGARRLEVKTSQGWQTAFYRPPRIRGARRPDFVWFILPGRASLALDFWGHTARWDGHFAYVFIDYPGYGCCEGQPNAVHIGESLAAVAERVRGDLGWSEHELQKRSGVLGHSLGCAASLILADRLQLKHVILCAPFTSLADMAKRSVGWPLCCLVGDQFDNGALLNSLTRSGTQVRIFHGTDDRTIPFAMSQNLAARFPNAVRLTLVPGCGHGSIVTQAEKEIGRQMLEFSDLAVPSLK